MATLAIYPKPSFRLAIILISLHLMAIFSIYLLPLSEELKTLGVAALIISLIYYLRMNVLLTGANAIKILVLSDEAPCQLTLRSGESCICSVLEDSFVAPFLTVVNLKLEGKFLPQSLVIVVDSLDVEEFRQLRVWLRWNKIIIKKQKGEVN